MKNQPQPRINLKLCTRCNRCVEGCPENALTPGAQGPVFREPFLCTYCLACEGLCPSGAIRAPLQVIWDSAA